VILLPADLASGTAYNVLRIELARRTLDLDWIATASTARLARRV